VGQRVQPLIENSWAIKYNLVRAWWATESGIVRAWLVHRAGLNSPRGPLSPTLLDAISHLESSRARYDAHLAGCSNENCSNSRRESRGVPLASTMRASYVGSRRG